MPLNWVADYKQNVLRCTALLFVAALCVSCSGEKIKAKRSGVAHFPLVDGREYQYRETQNGKATTYTMHFRFAGGVRYPVFDIELNGTDWGDCSFILQDSSITFATTKPRTALENPARIPEFRETWLDEAVEVGDSWDEPDTGTRCVFASDRETVQVPAGQYDGCLRLVVESLPALFDSLSARLQSSRITQTEYDRQTAQARGVIQRWFAPGVGLVKEQLGSPDHVRELLAITRDSRED